MREDKFKPIERLFSSYLEKEADKINADFSNVMCDVDAHFPPNDEPRYGYFSISLGCTLNKADLDKTDAISLSIDIDDHDNKFTMTADVVWGNPYARAVEKVFEEPVNVTEENLAIITENLPRLISRLREEIHDNPNGKTDTDSSKSGQF